MNWKVGMPGLGHTMDEGAVSEWLFAPGVQVSAGDVVATVETDKASVDIESPNDGVLSALCAPTGTTVPSEIAATIGERCFGSLDEPVTRIGSPFVPKPTTPSLEKHADQSVAQIIEAAVRMMPASRR